MEGICIEGLTKQYGGKKALDQISIMIEPNTITGLIGNNGAGKTTLMEICAGRISNSNGVVNIEGQKPYNNQQTLERIHYSQSDVNHCGFLPLDDLIQLFAVLYPRWNGELASQLMEYFGISKKEKYSNLSLGMKSSFNFITALATRAEYTLLDEPVLGMDGSVRKEVYQILLKDYLECPRTIVISSHLVSEMESILSHVILLDQGKVILHEEIDSLREMATVVRCSDEVQQQLSKEYSVLEKKGDSIILNASPEGIMAKYSRDAELQFEKVSVEDLCILLTKKRKGLDTLWSE